MYPVYKIRVHRGGKLAQLRAVLGIGGALNVGIAQRIAFLRGKAAFNGSTAAHRDEYNHRDPRLPQNFVGVNLDAVADAVGLIDHKGVVQIALAHHAQQRLLGCPDLMAVACGKLLLHINGSVILICNVVYVKGVFLHTGHAVIQHDGIVVHDVRGKGRQCFQGLFNLHGGLHTEIQILQLPHGQLHIAQNGVLGKIGANQVDHFHLAAVCFCRSTPLQADGGGNLHGRIGQKVVIQPLFAAEQLKYLCQNFFLGAVTVHKPAAVVVGPHVQRPRTLNHILIKLQILPDIHLHCPSVFYNLSGFILTYFSCADKNVRQPTAERSVL